MTTPSPAPSAPQTSLRPLTRLTVAIAVVLIVMKAFALGASGSVAILASLADTTLDLVGALLAVFAVHRAAALGPDGRGQGEALAALVQAGLVFASAVFVGWAAVERILDPRPLGAGALAVGIMAGSLVLTAALTWLQTRAMRPAVSEPARRAGSPLVADLAAGVAVLIGVVSGAWLGAPGLDAAAGLVIAIWMFWGAAAGLRGAADRLLRRPPSVGPVPAPPPTAPEPRPEDKPEDRPAAGPWS